jgi:dipeptidase E
MNGDSMRLLLLSNSRNAGEEYLAHVQAEIRDFLGPIEEVLFVPYAGVSFSHAEYSARVREAFARFGVRVGSVTEVDDPVVAARGAAAIVVGGGNTFQLLRLLYQTGLLDVVRQRVRAGVPYLGWSAGSNLACPTIRTTNDMPVVEPPSLAALDLVPFQINPHYTDRVLANHGGETRDERIAEFLILNPAARVLGLREGSWLRREGASLVAGGPHTVRFFRQGQAPVELSPGADLRFLLDPS